MDCIFFFLEVELAESMLILLLNLSIIGISSFIIFIIVIIVWFSIHECIFLFSLIAFSWLLSSTVLTFLSIVNLLSSIILDLSSSLTNYLAILGPCYILGFFLGLICIPLLPRLLPLFLLPLNFSQLLLSLLLSLDVHRNCCERFDEWFRELSCKIMKWI